jgi:hypothetical protein
MDIVDLGRPDYHSYLLRLWGNPAQTVWRASLQSTTTQQIHQFPSLEALVTFLVTELAATGDDAGQTPCH